MTENAPPRKPRRARWWVWVAALLPIAYVGGYSALRTEREFIVLPKPVDPSPRTGRDWAFWVADADMDHTRHVTWRSRLFRPCITVEEWWLNR